MMTRLCLALAFALFILTPARAQRDAKIPDPDPELERKTLQLPPGFEINLYAADPLLAKPIQMNFDAAGRLWVASSEVYPQIKPGQKANDKILVLEDTKGIGKADKVTVFADGLLIPTGIEPGDGGVYVADSTDILHLKDTDGDGKADQRRVVLSGFGTEDTHHIIHTFRWGHDGMLYFNQSVYIHSHVETPHGVRRLNAGGIWQFRPETMKLEVFVKGFWNTWGHHFDDYGQSFITDGAGGEGINYGIPGAYYAASYQPPRVLPGLNPGSPKYCGLEIMSGRHLPQDFQGTLVTHDFRGHRVSRFALKDDGAGYAAIRQGDLVASNHPAFRPIDVKMGPDGAIYIADWYNPIIQHGEVDFRDPRRDHTHGRIWRITAKDRALAPRPKLVGATTEELLEALKSPEQYTRHFAKRVMKERGAKDVKPALDAWVAKVDAREEHQLLEALWTYQSLDVPEPKLLERLLQAKDHRVRAAAVRVVPHWKAKLTNPEAALEARVSDEHPQVRLEAVRALVAFPSVKSAEVALRALDKPMDKFLDYGLFLTARELAPQWLPALQKGEIDFGGNPKHLVFALQASGSASGVQPLVKLLKDGKVAKDREEQALTMLAALGGPAELSLVLDRALAQEGNTPARQAALLAALEQAARQRNARPAGDLGRVEALLTSGNTTVRAGTARAVGAWKVESLRPKLLELARAEKSEPELREAAFEGLLLLGGPVTRTALEELADKDKSVAVRQRAVMALASLDVEGAAKRAVALFAADAKDTDPGAVVAAFLERKNGAKALTAALAEKKLPADAAKLGVRAARNAARAEPALVDAFTKAGNLTAPLRTLSPAEMQAMVADVMKQGDPARGEAIFRRKDQGCLKCHAIGGAGGQVGPDIASIGASAQIDYLIESILLPSKQIKENYHSLVVTTKDGRFLTGVKVRENKQELVLRNAEDKEIVIPTKDIEEKANGGSLMPEGLADALTRAELVDLVRFLSELGKVGPYAVSKARLVRRWEVVEASGALSSAYSRVSGELPVSDIPLLPPSKFREAGGTAQFRLDVSTGGKIKLYVKAPKGTVLGFDDRLAMNVAEPIELDLKPGIHVLHFHILDLKGDSLRVELEDVPGSRARVQIVGGK